MNGVLLLMLMCPSFGGCDRENLLVVDDQLKKGPPFVRVPLKSLETHGIGNSQNTMEKERGSFGLRHAPEGRAGVSIWSDVV